MDKWPYNVFCFSLITVVDLPDVKIEFIYKVPMLKVFL
jgi:hypothetical protein